jgi:thiol-disulfide isomerase/thioredoxin
MDLTRLKVDLRSEGRLSQFSGATGWLNSPPLTTDELRGTVVLVDFWTYTCINWLRTLGYVRAWSEKYADHGIVVVGVHTPEFRFARLRGHLWLAGLCESEAQPLSRMCVDLRDRAVLWLNRRLEEPPASVEGVAECCDEHAEPILDLWVPRWAVSDDEETVEPRVASIETRTGPSFERHEARLRDGAHPPAHDVDRIAERRLRACAGREYS